jgi:hypothetical protein
VELCGGGGRWKRVSIYTLGSVPGWCALDDDNSAIARWIASWHRRQATSSCPGATDAVGELRIIERA